MYTQKLTIEVDNDEYIKLTKGLHYGQLSAIMRKFIEDVNIKFDNGEKDEVLQWLYNDQPLILNKGKDNEDT